MKFSVNSCANFLFILVGTSLLDLSFGWSSQNAPSVGEMPSTAESTRRDAVRTFTALIGGTAVSTGLLSSSVELPMSTRIGLVGSAHADVTNKVASSTALRALTRAQDKLPTRLLPDVQANNFIGVKARIREPPFDTVRKNMQILVIGGEDGPKAKELVRSYKDVIAALEKIDGTASLGMRGRTIGPLEMTEQYEVLVGTLNSFLSVASEAAEIPLQDQPSMQENLRTGSIETKVLKGD